MVLRREWMAPCATSPAAPRGPRGRLAAALLAALAAAAPGCLKESGATSCASGIYCPAGTRCAAAQAACIVDDCGDGVLQAAEGCDDGNIRNDDGCSATCRSETCGDHEAQAGEECDDGNTVGGDGCSATCASERCGNAVVDVGEECDPGQADTAACLGPTRGALACKVSRHGDGFANKALDGSGQPAEPDCDGGDGWSCLSSSCDEDCTFSGPGDGTVNPLAGEECDGGPNAVAGSCASDVCTADCRRRRCGDGNEDPGEECDDVRAFVCATCDPVTCGKANPRAATGTITVGSAGGLADGDAFTLDDGTREVTFQLRTTGTCGANEPTCVEFDDTPPWNANAFAENIRRAIEAVHDAASNALGIGAARDGPVVALTHDDEGIVGNVPIEVRGAERLRVVGMSGGVGCPLGAPCSRDDARDPNRDCAAPPSGGQPYCHERRLVCATR